MARALIFCDSFDHWDLTYKKWALYTQGQQAPTFPSEGRHGECYKDYASNGDSVSIIGQNLSTPLVRGMVGFAFKMTNVDALSGYSYFLGVYDGNDLQWCWNVQNDGTLRLTRGPSVYGTLLSTGGAIRSGEWAWLELMWEMSLASGRIIARVNGITVSDYTGNICDSGVAQWTSVKLFPKVDTLLGHSTSVWVDDFTLWEPGTGSPPAIDEADFPGDCTVRPRRPNGVGNSSQWTPNGGSPPPDNYENTNDVLPDGDTTVVATGTTDDLDLYQIEDVGADAVILAAQVVAYARKTEEGSAQIAPVFRIGGSNYEGTAQAVPATTFQVLTWPYDVSPATNVAFTAAEFNAAESGPNKAA